MLSPLALCGTMLLKSLPTMVFRCYLVWFAVAFSQGETTSAIVGKVTDATGAAMPAARVYITNRETGLQWRPRMTRAASTFRNLNPAPTPSK